MVDEVKQEAQKVEPIKIDPLMAQGFLAAEKKERENRCMGKIIAILQEENCRADAKVIFVGSNFSSEVVVTANDGIPNNVKGGTK